MKESDFTIFDDRFGLMVYPQHASLEELASTIAEVVKPAKEQLPLVKLGTFGTQPSASGCLRHDENLIAITGIEADYDGGALDFDDAVVIAEKAGLAALLYTSPSHTPTAPRWRVLCPASGPLAPGMRDRLMARLNGLYGGIFASESWSLSQSYYFGRVNGAQPPQTAIVDGAPIDELDELDHLARGKPDTINPAGNGGNGAQRGPLDEQTLLEAIIGGTNYHSACVRLLGRWAQAGVPMMEAQQRLVTTFECVMPPDRDQRWRDRYNDIPRCVLGIYIKEADQQDHAAAFTLSSSSNTGNGAGPAPDDAGSNSPDAEPPPSPAAWEQPWPAPLGEAAYHGIIGDIVRLIAPQTEADPAALLLHTLVSCGNCLGRGALIIVEATEHFGNLFAVIAGDTSKARKGTSESWSRRVLRQADPNWEKNQISTGLSSGEGLIERVRDMRIEKKFNKQSKQWGSEIVDHGVADKRLLVVEEELSRALHAMRRSDNTLSAVLRQAWDGKRLGIMTRNSPITATDALISLIAHITIVELRAELSDLQAANGFGNRCLFACVKRSKLLPFGGNVDLAAMFEVAARLGEVLKIHPIRPLYLDTAARVLWENTYAELSKGGTRLFDALTARSEAQAIRVALIYALLDGQSAIGRHHLEAALEIVRYSNASAKYIFGDAVGNATADTILRTLRRNPQGVNRTEIYNLFGRHTKAGDIAAALAALDEFGLATCRRKAPASFGGRPPEIWVAR